MQRAEVWLYGLSPTNAAAEVHMDRLESVLSHLWYRLADEGVHWRCKWQKSTNSALSHKTLHTTTNNTRERRPYTRMGTTNTHATPDRPYTRMGTTNTYPTPGNTTSNLSRGLLSLGRVDTVFKVVWWGSCNYHLLRGSHDWPKENSPLQRAYLLERVRAWMLQMGKVWKVLENVWWWSREQSMREGFIGIHG